MKWRKNGGLFIFVLLGFILLASASPSFGSDTYIKAGGFAGDAQFQSEVVGIGPAFEMDTLTGFSGEVGVKSDFGAFIGLEVGYTEVNGAAEFFTGGPPVTIDANVETVYFMIPIGYSHRLTDSLEASVYGGIGVGSTEVNYDLGIPGAPAFLTPLKINPDSDISRVWKAGASLYMLDIFTPGLDVGVNTQWMDLGDYTSFGINSNLESWNGGLEMRMRF